ncbi:MAG: hypothetical protein ACRDZO_19290 [Egibacteraceae bacterium]
MSAVRPGRRWFAGRVEPPLEHDPFDRDGAGDLALLRTSSEWKLDGYDPIKLYSEEGSGSSVQRSDTRENHDGSFSEIRRRICRDRTGPARSSAKQGMPVSRPELIELVLIRASRSAVYRQGWDEVRGRCSAST